MISWIQKYFQHHFKTVFAVMLGLIIISFVFWTGNGQGFGRDEREAIKRPFFGYNLSSQEDQQRLMGDASISAGLMTGQFGGFAPEEIQQFALQRATVLHFAKEFHIPASSNAEITEFIKGLRAFAGQDGQFDATAYDAFRKNLKSNPSVTEATIARVIGDDVRAQKAQKLIAGPGYVLPADVKLQLSRTDTSWTLATAAIDYTSFGNDLKPSDADLTKFFEQTGGYDIPPRVVASYVTFPAVAYVGAVTVSEAEVRDFYAANPARFPNPNKAKTPAADLKVDADADFAIVRPQVETALRLERAQRLATKAASDFTYSLWQGKVTPAALEGALATQKLTAKPLAPFTQNEGPAELGGSREITEAAFKLNQDRFYTEALPTPTGAVVLFWKETQPSRKPLFSEVRAKVLADYIESEKRKRFVDLGRTLRAQLEARVKAGDAFDKAASAVASSNGVKVETKAIPAFTARTRPQDLDYTVLGALENLERGQISDMLVTADKGIFVYALEKKTPDLSETNPLFASARTQIATSASRIYSGEVLREIVDREIKKSEPKRPE